MIGQRTLEVEGAVSSAAEDLALPSAASADSGYKCGVQPRAHVVELSRATGLNHPRRKVCVDSATKGGRFNVNTKGGVGEWKIMFWGVTLMTHVRSRSWDGPHPRAFHQSLLEERA
eukprot:8997609-Pyramimonas_sp.AAC.2